MKKVLLMTTALLTSGWGLYAQQTIDSLQLIQLEEVVVSSTRAGKNSAIAHSNLNEEQIKRDNAARNIPYVLQTLPSVVAYSEDGSGLGNTQYRIRGTDANRINVTLNGMPVNNPESQDVFWVNFPDLSNSLKSLQVQRGVGTSTNGAASFGGSISLQTVGSRAKPYGSASTAIGSYNSFLSSIAAGMGVMKNGLSLDGRYSRSTGDGYIRNGKVDHKSGTVSLSHYTDKQMIRAIYINGIQHTGITWEGVDPAVMEEDRRYNPAGRYKDDMGNVKYYDNETDNYYSNIAQVLYSRNLSPEFTVNANISYNNGYGYYENYKIGSDGTGEKFSKYGIEPQTVEGVTYKKSDIIRRKSMSNDLYVAMASLNYHKDRLSLTGGAMYSYFDGVHYGRLLWVKHNQNIGSNHEWYHNESTKRDVNTFAKAEYNLLDNLTLSGELQYRYVDYRMDGADDDLVDITQNYHYSFFNPKVGLSYRFLNKNELYASFGVSNREPLRSDLKDYNKSNRTVNSERLFDYEFGYRYAGENFSFESNLYYMSYKDQLVLTGRLSDTGYKLQENVPDSYRMGIELSAAYSPLQWLRLDANTTLSRNKIKDYTVYYTTYDNQNDWNEISEQISEYKGTTDISYSPNVVGSGIVTIIPFKDFSLSLINKYVGKMYYDNTSNEENRLNDYFISNLMVGYSFDTQKLGKIEAQITINNIFNKKYEGNAWVDISKFQDGSQIVYKGLFPQAPCNIMARVGVSF